MEFFRQTNFDWIGKAKLFVAGSLIFLAIGAYGVYKSGGLRYGIDFKGGTLVYVRFAEKPRVTEIRAGLAAQGLGDSVIQEISDPTRPSANEVVIGIEQVGQGEQSLDAGKAAILQALQKTFGAATTAKPDLNEANADSLAAVLSRRDPLGLATAAGDTYTLLARRITTFRDQQRSGLLTAFDDLKNVQGATDPVVSTLRDAYGLGPYAVRNVEIVGPRVGAQLRKQALLATLYALAGMLVYIAFRFEWVYGAAAVIAVAHDVLITLGLFTLFGYEITLTVIAALLTLVGYSMNDTIVIFDRIRENLRTMRREPLVKVANLSINQTLSRTVLTSGLTFLTVIVLFLFGGPVLRGFSFALVVGIVIGTYSSFGIAAPIVVAWNRFRGGRAVVGSGTGGGRAKASNTADSRLATAGRR